MGASTQQTRGSALPGSAVERRGWWLLAFLAAVFVVFGAEAFVAHPSPTEAIVGSGCCNGHSLSQAPGWVYDYAGELAKYMGTYMVGTGVFALGVIFGSLRHGRRWAWYLAWYMPVLFAVHGVVLGSFPFDAVTLGISVLGLLLMIRPVFGASPERTTTDGQRQHAPAS